MAVNSGRGGRFHVEWLSPIPMIKPAAEDMDSMNYRGVQDLARSLHVELGGKKVEIWARIEEARALESDPSAAPVPDLEKLAADIDEAIDTVARHVPRTAPGETKLVLIDGEPHWRIRWFASMAIGARLSRIDPRFRRLRAADL